MSLLRYSDLGDITIYFRYSKLIFTLFHSFLHHETWNIVLGLGQIAYTLTSVYDIFKLLLSDVVDTVRLHPGPCVRKDSFPCVRVLSPESVQVSAPSGVASASETCLAQRHAFLGVTWIWLKSEVEHKDLSIITRCRTLQGNIPFRAFYCFGVRFCCTFIIIELTYLLLTPPYLSTDENKSLIQVNILYPQFHFSVFPDYPTHYT